MKTSIFEIFKIGIGPSSSHTVGPMRAARDFATMLQRDLPLKRVARLRAELYGSLALTGQGHATDRAILLGLLGETPDQVDPSSIGVKISGARQSKCLRVLGTHDIPFDETTDLLFLKDQILPGHPNAMRFTALDESGGLLKTDVYYSVGGGFISRAGDEAAATVPLKTPPYPFSSAAELLQIGDNHDLPI